MIITRYEISKDRVGLLRYFIGLDGKEIFYHVHSEEMNEMEKWLHGVLTAAQAVVNTYRKWGGTQVLEDVQRLERVLKGENDGE